MQYSVDYWAILVWNDFSKWLLRMSLKNTVTEICPSRLSAHGVPVIGAAGVRRSLVLKSNDMLFRTEIRTVDGDKCAWSVRARPLRHVQLEMAARRVQRLLLHFCLASVATHISGVAPNISEEEDAIIKLSNVYGIGRSIWGRKPRRFSFYRDVPALLPKFGASLATVCYIDHCETSCMPRLKMQQESEYHQRSSVAQL